MKRSPPLDSDRFGARTRPRGEDRDRREGRTRLLEQFHPRIGDRGPGHRSARRRGRPARLTDLASEGQSLQGGRGAMTTTCRGTGPDKGPRRRGGGVAADGLIGWPSRAPAPPAAQPDLTRRHSPIGLTWGFVVRAQFPSPPRGENGEEPWSPARTPPVLGSRPGDPTSRPNWRVRRSRVRHA
jgi:hypothetical protein